ncbi:hypothetical protein CQW23_27344 [Capsicum baccatum]|uniref:F-box associated beta-propeller type 1 domain-containing protein n=1 Tax=Capsicum baccatum TaxID=33114 RepID=A0A2G2VDG8_CAPBA|nr:hypothetical protein CQW23_27344 [Capsicum baccatum]
MKMSTLEKKKNVKLLAANRQVFKAVQQKNLISKANLFNQFINGEEKAATQNLNLEKFNLFNGEERFNLYNHISINGNTEHMDDVDEPMATHVQDEILMDILKRLPVKSLLRFKLSMVLSDRRSILLLWNPSTRESKVPPNPEFLEVGCRLGLGYASTKGDYKILKVNINVRDHSSSSEILNMKYGLWRKIDKHPVASWNLLLDTSSLAMVHETFHWIVAVGEYDVVTERKASLVSFSISNEVYGEIPLPEQVLCPTHIFRFGVSVFNEMLCVYSSSVCKSEAFKLWVMKDYSVKEFWNLVFTIYDPLICDFNPKYWFADGKWLYWFRHVRSRETAFRMSDESFVSWSKSGNFTGIAFTESLISPKSLFY